MVSGELVVFKMRIVFCDWFPEGCNSATMGFTWNAQTTDELNIK